MNKANVKRWAVRTPRPPPRTPHWLCPRANLHNGAAGALCQHYDGRSVVGRCRCRGTARHLVAQSATAASSRARSRRPENFSAHASHSGAHDVGVRPPRWTDCVALTLILRVGRSGPRWVNARLSSKTVKRYHNPLPQIDIIGAMVIVWRVRVKIIRSVLCNSVCNNCAQCDAHTWTDLTILWIGFLSHCAHFSVLRFVFVWVMCITVYCMHV